jgi:PAS domain S-box-containing protein
MAPVNLYRFIPSAVLTLGFALSAALGYRTYRSIETSNYVRFGAAVDQLALNIETRIQVYVAILEGACATISRERPTRAEFSRYFELINVSEKYNGIEGVGFAQRTEPEDRHSLEKAMLQQRQTFKIWPETTGVGFPIVLLEPETERNLRAIGYDMYTDAERKEGMDRAWQTGQPAATGKVTLVQESGEDSGQKQAGFLIYLPVYDHTLAADHVEPRDDGAAAAPGAGAAGIDVTGAKRQQVQRRERPHGLIGFVYSAFRADDLFNGIIGNRAGEEIAVEVFDGTDTSAKNLLHRSRSLARPKRGELTEERRMDIAGRRWTVRFHSGKAYPTAAPQVAAVVGSGAIITLLLATLLWSLERKRREASEHAALLARSAEAARDSERLKQAILDAALDCVITIDENATILEFNPAAERTFGHRRADVLGRSLVELIVAPALREQRLKDVERHLKTGAGEILNRRFEMTAIRAGGAEFPAELALSRIEVGGRALYTAYLRDISDRKAAEAEIVLLNSQLEERVARRTAQLQEANTQLEAFSYSVSHDLRAPVRHIGGYAELLAAELKNESHGAPSSQRYLDAIGNAAKRMERLISGLLQLSKNSRAPLNFRPVSMNKLVRDVLRLLEPETRGREIKWEIGPLPDAVGDEVLLGEVWSNLISNALKYTGRRPVAEISITGEEHGAEFRYIIRDNGAGFDMRYAAKLFGVFQRLHREQDFEGTGIGLANVDRIVKRHGGRVEVEAAVDQGAKFTVILPRSPDMT